MLEDNVRLRREVAELQEKCSHEVIASAEEVRVVQKFPNFNDDTDALFMDSVMTYRGLCRSRSNLLENSSTF